MLTPSHAFSISLQHEEPKLCMGFQLQPTIATIPSTPSSCLPFALYSSTSSSYRMCFFRYFSLSCRSRALPFRRTKGATNDWLTYRHTHTHACVTNGQYIHVELSKQECLKMQTTQMNATRRAEGVNRLAGVRNVRT